MNGEPKTARQAKRARRLDPLDLDYTADLADRDARLAALVGKLYRYRSILRYELRRLRAGEEPALVRGALERWAHVLRDAKRLAREL